MLQSKHTCISCCLSNGERTLLVHQNCIFVFAAKLVPLAYGIRKLQISCVVEDDKVSVDDLTEKILVNEDYVQSVDIAAFNKV